MDKHAEDAEEATPQPKSQPQLTWAKYDFVPGMEIIFEDNQEGEQNGEFPSKWIGFRAVLKMPISTTVMLSTSSSVMPTRWKHCPVVEEVLSHE